MHDTVCWWFVCAFEKEQKRTVLRSIGKPLGKFGLELSRRKRDSHSCNNISETSFDFLAWVSLGKDRQENACKRDSAKSLRKSLMRFKECVEKTDTCEWETSSTIECQATWYYNYYGVHGNTTVCICFTTKSSGCYGNTESVVRSQLQLAGFKQLVEVIGIEKHDSWTPKRSWERVRPGRLEKPSEAILLKSPCVAIRSIAVPHPDLCGLSGNCSSTRCGKRIMNQNFVKYCNKNILALKAFEIVFRLVEIVHCSGKPSVIRPWSSLIIHCKDHLFLTIFVTEAQMKQ